MSITKTLFGTHNGKDVYEYTLIGSGGLKAKIITLGGIIQALEYKGTDVVLGYDTLGEYVEKKSYFGALVGRNSNRIENASFVLGDKEYKLFANNGRNNLHGGKEGFDKKIWDAEIVDGNEPTLILTYVSPDGEEGFPGNVSVKVTYTVTSENAIRIHYEATTDADTVINMTNHSYFNLNGHSSGEIYGHKLWVDSDFYTPNNKECLPTGEVLCSKNTVFDFSQGAVLGDRIESTYEQIALFGGFDHNFVLNGFGIRKVATLWGDKTDITMEVYTDRPAMQVYTVNSMKATSVSKNGAVYSKHSAVCLETQAFPNNLKFSHFPGSVLKKGEKYDTVTMYKFV